MTTILRLLACAALFMAVPSPLFAQATPPAPPVAPAAPLAAAPDYSAIRAQSAALSKDDRARAKQLFATAFTLWQSGDFAAAEIAFKQGLDIDPANGVANYYYADCLQRRADNGASEYFSRTIAFAAQTSEAFKARAVLGATKATEDKKIADEASFIGKWNIELDCSYGSGTDEMTIQSVSNPGFAIDGLCHLEDGHVDGDSIAINCHNWAGLKLNFIGKLVSPGTIKGTYHQSSGYDCKWTGNKQ